MGPGWSMFNLFCQMLSPLYSPLVERIPDHIIDRPIAPRRRGCSRALRSCLPPRSSMIKPSCEESRGRAFGGRRYSMARTARETCTELWGQGETKQTVFKRNARAFRSGNVSDPLSLNEYTYTEEVRIPGA